MRLSNLVMAAALSALVLPGAASLSRAAENILFNCFTPAQHPFCATGAAELKRRVESVTEGRVTVTVPPKSLAGPLEQLQGVKSGVMDAAFALNTNVAEATVGMQITALPFVAQDNGAASAKAHWETYQKFFAGKPGEFDDVVLISMITQAGSEIWSTIDTPITSMQSLADRKMWALPGPAANLMKAAQSPVVAGPVVQMLELISRNVVDGYAGGDWTTVEQYKLGEYTKSVTVFDGNIVQGTFPIFVSKEKWQSISEEDQKAILEALGGNFAFWMSSFMREKYLAARERFSEKIETIEASAEFEAQLRALAQPEIDAWNKRAAAMGINGDEVIAYYLDAYNRALAE